MATHAETPRTGGEVGTVGDPGSLDLVGLDQPGLVFGILGGFFDARRGRGRPSLWSLAAMGGMTALSAARGQAPAGRTGSGGRRIRRLAILVGGRGRGRVQRAGNTAVRSPMAWPPPSPGQRSDRGPGLVDDLGAWPRWRYPGSCSAIYGYQYTLGDDAAGSWTRRC